MQARHIQAAGAVAGIVFGKCSDLTDSGGFTGSCPLRGKGTRMATDLENMENMAKSGNLKVVRENVFLPVM